MDSGYRSRRAQHDFLRGALPAHSRLRHALYDAADTADARQALPADTYQQVCRHRLLPRQPDSRHGQPGMDDALPALRVHRMVRRHHLLDSPRHAVPPAPHGGGQQPVVPVGAHAGQPEPILVGTARTLLWSTDTAVSRPPRRSLRPALRQHCRYTESRRVTMVAIPDFRGALPGPFRHQPPLADAAHLR